MRMPKKINIPHPYYAEVYLFSISSSDKPKDARKLAGKIHKLTSSSIDETWSDLSVCGSASMCVFGRNKNAIMMCVNEDTLTDEYYDENEIYSLVAHESKHILSGIESQCYLEGETFDEETQAYLLQRIVEHIGPVVLRWYKESGKQKEGV